MLFLTAFLLFVKTPALCCPAGSFAAGAGLSGFSQRLQRRHWRLESLCWESWARLGRSNLIRFLQHSFSIIARLSKSQLNGSDGLICIQTELLKFMPPCLLVASSHTRYSMHTTLVGKTVMQKSMWDVILKFDFYGHWTR